MEYCSKGRKAAIKALESLAKKKFLIKYTKGVVEGKQKKEKKYTISDLCHIIQLEKIDGILRITPHPLMFDQMKTYWMSKPTNIFDLAGPNNLQAVRFLQYLLYHMDINRRKENAGEKPAWKIKISMEHIAYWLRMDAYLDQRKKSVLRKKLTSFYELAKRIGYLESFLVDQKQKKGGLMDIMQLSKTFFEQMKSGEV